MVERSLTLPCGDFTLEGRYAEPASARGLTVLCHPHPAFGGNMDVPLLVALRDAAFDAGLATLRFNFRGVGTSGGRGSGGQVEHEDVLSALAWAQGRHLPVSLCGYSFGAAMALGALAAGAWVERLCAIGLPTESLGGRGAVLSAALDRQIPVQLITGTDDTLSRIETLRALASGRRQVEIVALAGVDHFAGGSDTHRVTESALRFLLAPSPVVATAAPRP